MAADPHPTLFPAPVRNVGLFSGHWLEHRLELEPDWAERSEADALTALGKLCAKERTRVEKYGDEQGMEEAFIQPVFKAVGWTLKYQTFLQDRKPDDALFPDDALATAHRAAGAEAAPAPVRRPAVAHRNHINRVVAARPARSAGAYRLARRRGRL